MLTTIAVSLVAALAVPFLAKQFPFFGSGPVVKLDYGAFEGATLDGIEMFLGMPYAAPPVGQLRFDKPHPPIPFSGTRKAKQYGPGCHPQKLTMNPDFHIPQPALDADVVSEDCLTMNVYKPANVPPDAKLPVIFFIHGGGFALGSTSKMDAGTHFVNRTMSFGKPIVYVSANYRLNAFGFLANRELQAQGATNAGLQDQQLALRWAQKYIHLFGGDPEKIVLWGQSAGAISIGLHMILNGGNHEGLFRGAVMQSGAPTPLGDMADGAAHFAHLADRAGCAPGPASDRLACLRAVPEAALVAAIGRTPNLFQYGSINVVWQPRVDGVVLRADPLVAVARGEVARVPFIQGACDDEGTLFAMSSLNVTTNGQFVEYVKYLTGADDKQAARIARVYPDDPAAGSPYDTGDQFALSPQYKRIASFQGDWVFHQSKRHLLQHTLHTHAAWSYLYKRGKAQHFLGAAHGADFGAFRADPAGYDFLLNFAYNLDPNVPLAPASALGAPWPRYDAAPEGVALTFLDPHGLGTAPDSARKEALGTVTAVGLELAAEKAKAAARAT